MDPRLVWRDECLTLLIPAALFFFGAGMLFPLVPAARWSRSPSWRAPLARWSRSAKHWFRRAGVALCDVAANGQGSLGLLMTLMGLLIVLCCYRWRRGCRIRGSLFKLTSPSIVISSMGERCCFIKSRITRYAARSKNKTPDSPHKARCLVIFPSVRAQAMPVARLAVTAGCDFSLPHHFCKVVSKSSIEYD